MIKVPYGQDPYSVIGKYIRDHITAIEDIIAVIKIDDITTNQLFMADMNEENYFIWANDWYEGEKDVALIDFFPVSEAINPSAQPVDKDIDVPSTDTISRQAAIEIASGFCHPANIAKELAKLPSAQPQLPEWAQKVEEYRKSAPSFVRNQLVWALYQTWKEYDGRLVHQRGKENR